VRDGDLIEIDAEARLLTVALDAAELSARLAKWTAPAPRYRTGVMAKYAKLVSSASTGAVTG
jgi:dihydroxy-acid dehydratase